LIIFDLSAQQIVLGTINDTAAKAQTNVIPGVELIEYVGNTSSSKGAITGIVYKLNNSKHKPTKVIKPHLYRVSGKTVGEELLPTNVSPVNVTSKGKRITLQVDISKYNIELPPDGVFIGIEYIGTNPADKKKVHPLTVWRNEFNTSSLSYSKYNNVFDKDSLTFSRGFCFGIQIKSE
jgi:hypothetical protein